MREPLILYLGKWYIEQTVRDGQTSCANTQDIPFPLLTACAILHWKGKTAVDLCELKSTQAPRHPWEIVRAKALREILHDRGRVGKVDRVLDVGCGDGFTISQVCRDLAPVTIDAVDSNLTREQIASFSAANGSLNFFASSDALPHNSYQLLTLFDVLEHVENDGQFLADTVRTFATPQATIFITLPAFNWLTSSHDSALRHHRRYNRAMLTAVTSKAGLRVKAYGFLFSGLLPVRMMTVLREKLARHHSPSFKGVGQWHHGRTISTLVEKGLSFDCWLTITAQNLGIQIPGLTLWGLCEPLP